MNNKVALVTVETFSISKVIAMINIKTQLNLPIDMSVWL